MTVYEAELAVIDAVRILRRLPTGLARPGSVNSVDPGWWRQLDVAFGALDALEIAVKEEAG